MDEEFKKQFSQLLTDVASIKSICSEMKTSMEVLMQEVTHLKNENEENKTQIKNLKIENQELKRKLYETDQYNKKNNVIINGIPQTEEENLKEVLKNIPQKLEVEDQDYHICALHRLPSKRKIPPIIVRLNNSVVRRDLVRNSKKKRLNGNAFGIGPQPIFVDEHLSQGSVELLEARKIRDEGKIKYTWFEGKVLIREKESSPAIKISDFTQLQSWNMKKRNIDIRSPEATNEEVEGSYTNGRGKKRKVSKGEGSNSTLEGPATNYRDKLINFRFTDKK